MMDVVLNTIPTFLLHSIDYNDEAGISDLASWKRGGIRNFIMCHVFDSDLKNVDSECESIARSIDNVEYVGFGSFEIIADESIMTYQDRIIEIVTSDYFKDAFNNNMNKILNNITNSDGYQSFDAIQFELYDPMNVTGSSLIENKDEAMNDSVIAVIIVCVVLFIIIIAALIWFWRYRQKKENLRRNTAKTGDYQEANVVEMHEKGEGERDGMEEEIDVALEGVQDRLNDDLLADDDENEDLYINHNGTEEAQLQDTNEVVNEKDIIEAINVTHVEQDVEKEVVDEINDTAEYFE